MRNDGKDRCEELAAYVLDTNATVRAAAAHFGISKSTVHKDLTHKLKFYSKPLFIEVQKVLAKNKSERHLRGGEATRQKYIRVRTKHRSSLP